MSHTLDYLTSGEIRMLAGTADAENGGIGYFEDVLIMIVHSLNFTLCILFSTPVHVRFFIKFFLGTQNFVNFYPKKGSMLQYNHLLKEADDVCIAFL